MAACHAAAGNDREATKQTAETLRPSSGFSAATYVARQSYKNAAGRERLRDSLIKAGLPD